MDDVPYLLEGIASFANIAAPKKMAQARNVEIGRCQTAELQFGFQLTNAFEGLLDVADPH